MHTFEPLVFFRSLLHNPLTIGAVVPSSSSLCQLIASRVDPATSSVLEVGAGTGPVTRALLERGVGPERLFLIERDPSLAAYLHRRFPGVRVRCGDAVHAGRILSDEAVGQVKTVISSLPIRNLSGREQLKAVRGMLNALAPGGQLIQFTYASRCPISIRKFGLRAECVGRVWMNIPPATVWRFTRNTVSTARPF